MEPRLKHDDENVAMVHLALRQNWRQCNRTVREKLGRHVCIMTSRQLTTCLRLLCFDVRGRCRSEWRGTRRRRKLCAAGVASSSLIIVNA